MRSRNYLVIALISLTLIPLELAWTRIFSAEFFFTFAFLILSLAILGLGLGALALRLFRFFDRTSYLGIYLALAGLCALVGPIVVFKLGLDFSQIYSSWLMIGKIALTVLILMSAFFFGGMGLAVLFKYNHQDMPRLYMADLLGAGVGVLAAIWAMNFFGTPTASFLIALPILVASLIAGIGWTRIVPILVAAAVFVLYPSAEQLLEVEREERAPVIYKHWDAMSKVKMYDYGGEARGLNIDNVANSPVYQFDGNWDDVKPGETPWGINVSYLIQQFDSCVFLSLGSGGGGDVMQALAEGATEVHAVEVNAHINHMMVHGDPDGYLPMPPPEADTTVADSATVDATDTSSADTTVEVADSSAESEELATSDGANDSSAVADTATGYVTCPEFTGYLYNDPRVRVITEDARAYVRRFENKFDVIFSLSSNSWAALASGAFALAESYIFTTEAFMDYWRSLSDSGFMMMEHQVYAPRLVSEVVDALNNLGVEDPTSHFAVYDLPQMRRKMILLSKRPLTDELRYLAFGELTPEKFEQIHLLYPPANDSVADNWYNRIVTEGWVNVADSAPVDVSPVTDDRPFVGQMGLWRNLDSEKMQRLGGYADFYGFPLSHIIMLVLLAVIIVLVLPANLLPYFTKGEHLRAVPWLYFFFIGVAFMAVEVVLIQKYALLIGPSVYSIVTILLTLLIASGIGSRFSRKIGDTTAFVFIVVWLLLDAFVFKQLLYAAGGLSMFPRILISALLIFPLGFFMGMPFPKGAIRAGDLIDWGFAVNGAASVLGSIVVLLIAFTWGFTMALTFAAVMYLMAFVLIKSRAAWR
ncbi:MAG: hypothetical protein JSU74_12780 [Candidatus Zixiibacteriota bacterium]|nr:MAG: hypothetical protein JSU74_12780 [candidate division Zixibacteria bacterium]